VQKTASRSVSVTDLPIDAASAASPRRLPWIDAARGIAIAAMVVYHFSWDLRHFGFIAVDVTEQPGWRLFARLIAGSFLALVGVGLVLATRRGFSWSRFLRRVALIAAGAAAITVATRIAMPEEYIFFGVLHCIAVSSLLAVPFLRAPVLLVIAAAGFCFLGPTLLSGPAFDWPPLLWLGLMTVEPRSNDFVPVFPWFGVVLAGIAAARLAQRFAASRRTVPAAVSAPGPLVWAGRRSLVIYLLHQPILFGLVYLGAQAFPPNLLVFTGSYVQSCTAMCTQSGEKGDMCRTTCQCLAERTQAAGLWKPLMQSTLSEDQTSRYYDLADQCRAESGDR
jgi:uncharacterized membrane protein